MKNLLLLSCLCLFINTAQAQIEAKINPLGLLFKTPEVSAEYLVNDDIGVELAFGIRTGSIGSELTGFDRTGFRLRVSGKYYFNPEDGGDKFYAGIYLGPKSHKWDWDDQVVGQTDLGYKVAGFTLGVLGGYKWVADNGLVFELALGLGRTLGENITFNDEDNQFQTVDGFGIDGITTLAVGYRF